MKKFDYYCRFPPGNKSHDHIWICIELGHDAGDMQIGSLLDKTRDLFLDRGHQGWSHSFPRSASLPACTSVLTHPGTMSNVTPDNSGKRAKTSKRSDCNARSGKHFAPRGNVRDYFTKDTDNLDTPILSESDDEEHRQNDFLGFMPVHDTPRQDYPMWDFHHMPPPAAFPPYPVPYPWYPTAPAPPQRPPSPSPPRSLSPPREDRSAAGSARSRAPDPDSRSHVSLPEGACPDRAGAPGGAGPAPTADQRDDTEMCVMRHLSEHNTDDEVGPPLRVSVATLSEALWTRPVKEVKPLYENLKRPENTPSLSKVDMDEDMLPYCPPKSYAHNQDNQLKGVANAFLKSYISLSKMVDDIVKGELGDNTTVTDKVVHVMKILSHGSSQVNNFRRELLKQELSKKGQDRVRQKLPRKANLPTMYTTKKLFSGEILQYAKEAKETNALLPRHSAYGQLGSFGGHRGYYPQYRPAYTTAATSSWNAGRLNYQRSSGKGKGRRSRRAPGQRGPRQPHLPPQ